MKAVLLALLVSAIYARLACLHRDHSTVVHSVRVVEGNPELLAWGQMLLAREAA